MGPRERRDRPAGRPAASGLAEQMCVLLDRWWGGSEHAAAATAATIAAS
jgi:hypothetical protein